MTHPNEYEIPWLSKEDGYVGKGKTTLDMPFINGLQKTDRLKGIGGSDIAPIVGEIPSFHKRDGTTVYLEKIGARPQFQGNKATKWGTLIEELLIREYLNANPDITMFTLKRGQTIRHAEYPFIYATPDGICFDEEGNIHVFEAKTTRFPSNKDGARWGEEGSSTIPCHVLCQIAWYNMVLSSWGVELEDYTRVALLVGGQDDRVYTIERDRDYEEHLLEKGIEFWEQNVLAKLPPDPSHTKAYGLILKDRYPAPTNQVLAPASGDIEKIARDYYETKKELASTKDKLENKLERIENKLREYIGNNEGVVGKELVDGKGKPTGKHEFKLTWKLERKVSTNKGNILKELGAGPGSEIYNRHTKTTHTRVLRKNWKYEEE